MTFGLSPKGWMWSSWCLGLRKNSRWKWQCEQSSAVEGAQSSLEKEVTAARVKWRWGCRIKDEASCCWWWCYELRWGSQNSQVNCSVQFSCSVMSDSLQPHGLQHARPPCPLPTPGVYPNSCPLSRWSHPTISSSVIPFSSHLQSFPASGSFPRS